MLKTYEREEVNDCESPHLLEHRCHIRMESECTGDWLVLRTKDADGTWCGGLQTDGKPSVGEMVEYTAK